jgi:hypothetical protein
VGLVGLGMLALAGAASTAKATTTETGKLTFHSELAWRGHRVDCPTETPASVVCRQHEGSGVIPGLGAVTERYLFLNQTGTAECPGNYRVLALSIQFIVGTKGTIQIASAPSTDCMPEGQAVTLNFPSFTITGGSGIYSGASGTGTFRKLLRPASAGAFPEPGMAIGKDIWDGTLLVPGLAFDTTAPVVRGATTKNVVAPGGVKRVHVRYRLSALDETDGALPVSCRPPTGSLFKVGRTVVACSATDKSGNTGRARFTVTVRARR